jgi:adenylate cyclase
MAQEIERKFLVNTDLWQPQTAGIKIMQCYLARTEGMTLRLRLADDKAFLTLKGATRGITRSEFEYAIPRQDALDMIKEFPVSASVCKMRYYSQVGNHRWEVDIFEGANAGLAVAEIELESVDEKFELPEWVTREVSGDRRYRNAYLAEHPYNSWVEKPESSDGSNKL